MTDKAMTKDDSAVAATERTIRIQVCYVTPEVQALRQLSVPVGTLLHDGIKRSGLLEEIREIDLSCWRVGIFGKLKTLDTVLRDQDRIEIYRPLIADPMESRRKRADKRSAKAADKKAR
ncbi:RnfH family protein [Collimonas sp.]|jgi:putative ubiquitin-RnfH superfamily antitoxin RatB of RatAB toxin-antitoxin module|uniref:RnfH family protein n=1 Tax=Collimonas sp. TaxID=1963772 RepID=UPI002CA62817|nr:RnfH family protein [Collimonas sp.]HWW03863.1 RnfH family protein [Collimonas sp.]